VVEDFELRGRHVGVPHELLREDLAPFDPRRGLARPENAQALLVEGVHDSPHERLFRADDRQSDVLLLGEPDELVEFGHVDRHVDAVDGRPRVARRAEDLFDPRRLGELPDQGMLPTAFSDNEDFHARLKGVRFLRRLGASPRQF
jgi:hypothetical protein